MTHTAHAYVASVNILELPCAYCCAYLTRLSLDRSTKATSTTPRLKHNIQYTSRGDPPGSILVALTKLGLSNHKLAIETGRYSRPFKKPAERTCPICKIEMEDEYHFFKYMPCLPGKTMFVTRLFGKRI